MASIRLRPVPPEQKDMAKSIDWGFVSLLVKIKERRVESPTGVIWVSAEISWNDTERIERRLTD
jgi:hypothetical protein